MKKKTKHPLPTPTSPIIPDATSSSSAESFSTGREGYGSGPWFGDFNALCITSCIPLPACNLLLPSTALTTGNDTLTSYFQTSSSSAGAGAGARAEVGEMGTFEDRCLNTGWPVRDVGSVVVSVLGLAFVTWRILCKSRRMFSAVGRTEIGFLYMIYSVILLLQIFTVGGVLVPRTHQNFLMWATALHLGALVCFFWTLVITALVLFQFTDDGTKYMKQFITGTNIIWMGIVVFLSLDLAWNITGDHHGHSPGLYFLTLVFPAVAVTFYLVLSCVVVFRKLEIYSSLKYIAMALITFSLSQLILFGASYRIAVWTHGHVNGSMFAFLLDLVSVGLTYKFWRSITDDTWGDADY
ncbi:MAG: chitin synthase III catalytic subunit-domain-containing protein [Linnemannia gamsii]|nr:MAG: chitin synthase III catalytic subunit-domain-containing protein [Linnemannia gamsii]